MKGTCVVCKRPVTWSDSEMTWLDPSGRDPGRCPTSGGAHAGEQD